MLFCIDTFGEDRAYFAGDWPVCRLRATIAQWVGALKTIVKARPLTAQKKLFAGNAEKFYGSRRPHWHAICSIDSPLRSPHFRVEEVRTNAVEVNPFMVMPRASISPETRMLR